MNRLILSQTVLVAVFITAFVSGFAQEKLKPFLPFKTDNPPVIDGILDDPIWKEAPFETGFVIYHPDYGKPMTEDTKVWYAYDRENLFFAFKCYDSEPDKIKTSVTARDKIRPDDWICLNLDTFNDHQSLYALYTNPMGIQMDSRATGDYEDYSMDFVWYSEGKIDEEGYTIEMRSPFKSIRFSYKEPVEMGIIFERYISRKSEAGTYPALDPKHGPNFFTQTRPLIYRDVKHYRLFELLPAYTYGNRSSIENGKLVRTEQEGNVQIGDQYLGDLSLTAKYGITSHLVLDGTYNLDFSQVEADVGQVDFNQRFALFYPEKRPFFLEGRENFVFGAGGGGEPLGAVVHTRMIVNPLVGIKLTGKVGERNTFASIYALDELPTDLQQGKYAHFGILRYKRALSQDSYIGGFYTGRELDDSHNRVFGADGLIRIDGSNRIEFHAFLSQSEDRAQAMKDNGHALGMNYYYYTRDLLINVTANDLSDDFRTETGYLTRTGITRASAVVMPMLYPKSTVIRRIDPVIYNEFIYDKDSRRWENSNALQLSFILPRTSRIQLTGNYATEIFLREKFKTSAIRVSGNSQFTKQFYFSLSYRYGQKIRYVANPYQGKGSSASASVNYQPSDKFQSSLSYTYTDFFREADSQKEFDYSILWFRNTYQVNKYLFFRVILQYNSFYEELMTDFLASFTYIPGTVIHIGYGSLYNKIAWDGGQYVDSDRFLETERGFFFKTSYLWRM
ncbi:MAG: carbohydrate binding family 9 domain-containing protein [bacterium]